MTLDKEQVVEPLSASDEATIREMHAVAFHRRQQPNCLVCSLFATVDTARSGRPATIHGWTSTGCLCGHPWSADTARSGRDSDPEMELRERVAEAIYDAMRENDPEGRGHPWVLGGNSRMQDEARRRAARALADRNP